MLQNIYKNWLQFIFLKINRTMPVYTKQDHSYIKTKPPYGYIVQDKLNYKDGATLEHNLKENNFTDDTKLEVHIMVPQEEKMQYFMQWQRFRKFWWSSITTTPSLLTLDNIKHENEVAYVNINAQFPWGIHAVESVQMNPNNSLAHICCSFSLQHAMITLLLDSMNNSKDYLRIHRKMAPYKISYAIDCTEPKSWQTLLELAVLLHHRLNSRKILNFLPKFECMLEKQIHENLQMGVTYTLVLSEVTLSNGIFHLLNSNTKLKEQLHVADFELYAALICN